MSDETDDFKAFDYEKAARWIEGWVETVDHPQLTWAWDAVVGVLDVYANLNVTSDTPLSMARKELWFDWFNAWQDGDAHYGIHGVMQEFAHACPDEHMDHQVITLNEAYDIGMGRKLAPRGGKKRQPPETKPTAPTLRVVIDNTTTATRKP